MKAYKGTRAAAPPVLNLDIKQRRVFRCTQRPFYPRGKNPSTHWNRRPDGLQNRSVHFGGKSLAPVGIRAPNHSARRLVAIPTKQSQLIKIIQLHNTKIPSIYLESRHDLQKKGGGGLLDIKIGLQFPPYLLFRTFIAAIKIHLPS